MTLYDIVFKKINTDSNIEKEKNIMQVGMPYIFWTVKINLK